MNHMSIHQETYDAAVQALSWDVSGRVLLIVWGTDDKSHLEIINTQTWTSQVKGELVSKGKLQSATLNEGDALVLLVFEKEALLLNLPDFTIRYSIKREDGFLGGDFGEAGNIHFTISASSGSVDWSIWKPETNESQDYELERYDHYGRGAVLHPSKKLIGACWSAYSCGFLIHTTEPKNKRLYYFDFDEEGCDRSEYEAHAPAFNFRGDKFAFVVNPYLGGEVNIEKLCWYDISNPKAALKEADLTDFEKESVMGNHFLGQTDHIVLHKSHGLDLVDFDTGKTTRFLQGEIDFLAVNPHSPDLIYAKGKRIEVLRFEGMPTRQLPQETAANFAREFIAEQAAKLELAGDWEVQFSVSSEYADIPKLYVKFGFERATYRLDKVIAIKENLSHETKAKVAQWLKENREEHLKEWRTYNSDKKVIGLQSEDHQEVDIVFGNRVVRPVVRVFFKTHEWTIDIREEEERQALPANIVKPVNDWIDQNREEILETWIR